MGSPPRSFGVLADFSRVLSHAPTTSNLALVCRFSVRVASGCV